MGKKGLEEKKSVRLEGQPLIRPSSANYRSTASGRQDSPYAQNN